MVLSDGEDFILPSETFESSFVWIASEKKEIQLIENQKCHKIVKKCQKSRKPIYDNSENLQISFLLDN